MGADCHRWRRSFADFARDFAQKAKRTGESRMMKSATVPHTAQKSLRDLGVSWQLINLPLPYLWLLPQTSDPDTAGVIEIVRAIQRGLVKIGFGDVRVSGTLDAATAKALRRVSGPWEGKAWIQIINDVVSTMRDPERAARAAAAIAGGLGDYIAYEPGPAEPYGAGPFPGRLIGTPPGPLGLGETATDQGVSLTWGAGVSGRGTCVPIPQKSGVTYKAFVNLQRQINRLSSKFGGTKIAEDGVLGTGTLAALAKLNASIGQQFPTASCGVLASRAVEIGSFLKNYADTMGLKADAGKPGGVLAKVPIVGAALQPPSDADSTAVATLKKYGPFFALAAGVAWFAAKSRKGGKKPAGATSA
jgi:hypothetical protein